jgi:hypothetical protein
MEKPPTKSQEFAVGFKVIATILLNVVVIAVLQGNPWILREI